MKKSLKAGMLATVIALMGASCGSDDEPLGINNVAPRGSVGGVVVDLSTGEPIAGVEVTVVAGAAVLPASDGPVVTDSSGRFSVADVPSGDVIVVLAPPTGYLPVRIQATLDDAAGEFPKDNSTLSLGPVALAPLAPDTSPFVVRLLLPSGAPAASVQTSARVGFSWALMNNDRPTAQGLTLVEAVSDAAGLAAFKGLPDFARLASLDGQGGITDEVRVWIPPADTTGDGIPDFLGTVQTFSVNAISSAVPTVVLSSTVTQLQIVASTIPGLDKKAGTRVLPSVSGPFFVAFNLPLHEGLTSASLYDGDGVAVEAPTLNFDGTMLSMSFTNLVEGQEYNLNLRAVGVANGGPVERTFSTPFFVPIAGGTEVTTSLSRQSDTDPVVDVTFNLPIGTGNPGQNNLPAVYFDYDLDDSGRKGDYPGEVGATSSNIRLLALEADPPGDVGPSGFTRDWQLVLPTVVVNANLVPVPGGTAVYLYLANRSPLVTRASGELVGDFTTTVP